jgi:hypothetical protein
MLDGKDAKKPSVLETVNTFVTAVPWGGGNWRSVVVQRREHAGRVYLNLWTWNRHRTKLVWYPTRRHFVIPLDNAQALANAICKAAAGWTEEKPDWLQEQEAEWERRKESDTAQCN